MTIDTSTVNVSRSSVLIEERSPWGTWWLTLVTAGIYYFVWYHKINSEISDASGEPRDAWTQWWNQLIPVWNLIGLHHTAKRLNRAIEYKGVFGKVSTGVAWFWAPVWFGTQSVYIQRRLNLLKNLTTSQEIK